MFAIDLSPFFHKELCSVFCGPLLGAGAARRVYEDNLNPYQVIKIETEGKSFQNVVEWETWQRVKDTDLAKWFAPCMSISLNGTVLVQRRTTGAAVHPTKVPAFFTDLKCANWGILTPTEYEKPGQFVCHDYGLHLMLEKGMTKRMRTAHWGNEQ